MKKAGPAATDRAMIPLRRGRPGLAGERLGGFAYFTIQQEVSSTQFRAPYSSKRNKWRSNASRSLHLLIP